MALPESVDQYLRNMDLNKKRFGGVDEVQALEHMREICILFQKEIDAVEDEKNRVETSLKASNEVCEERAKTIQEMKDSFSGAQEEAASRKEEADRLSEELKAQKEAADKLREELQAEKSLTEDVRRELQAERERCEKLEKELQTAKNAARKLKRELQEEKEAASKAAVKQSADFAGSGAAGNINRLFTDIKGRFGKK